MKVLVICLLFVVQDLPSIDSQCYTCNTATGFACLSINQYATCTAGVIDLTNPIACGTNYVCNQNIATTPCTWFSNLVFSCLAPPVAIPTTTVATTASTAASTSTTTTTATTTTAKATTALASFNANSWCAAQTVGNYPHPSYATGCIWYVKCHYFNSTMNGASYSCLGSTRFNPAIGFCDANYAC